jgi:hypothetical protein
MFEFNIVSYHFLFVLSIKNTGFVLWEYTLWRATSKIAHSGCSIPQSGQHNIPNGTCRPSAQSLDIEEWGQGGTPSGGTPPDERSCPRNRQKPNNVQNFVNDRWSLSYSSVVSGWTSTKYKVLDTFQIISQVQPGSVFQVWAGSGGPVVPKR